MLSYAIEVAAFFFYLNNCDASHGNIKAKSQLIDSRYLLIYVNVDVNFDVNIDVKFDVKFDVQVDFEIDVNFDVIFNFPGPFIC